LTTSCPIMPSCGASSSAKASSAKASRASCTISGLTVLARFQASLLARLRQRCPACSPLTTTPWRRRGGPNRAQPRRSAAASGRGRRSLAGGCVRRKIALRVLSDGRSSLQQSDAMSVFPKR
jgi:hypothetical protein